MKWMLFGLCVSPAHPYPAEVIECPEEMECNIYNNNVFNEGAKLEMCGCGLGEGGSNDSWGMVIDECGGGWKH